MCTLVPMEEGGGVQLRGCLGGKTTAISQESPPQPSELSLSKLSQGADGKSTDIHTFLRSTVSIPQSNQLRLKFFYVCWKL